MTPAQRLRHWADNFETYGPDVTRWGGLPFVIAELRRIAHEFDRLATFEAAEEDYRAWQEREKKESEA